MGLLDSLGSIINYGGGYAQAKQQALMNYSSQMPTWTWASGSTTANITIGNAMTSVNAGDVVSVKKPEPIPDTNLAWLDRRVNEMRVAL